MPGYTRPGARWIAISAILVCTGLAVHHSIRLTTDGISDLELVMSGAFLWLCFAALLPHFHRDVRLGRYSVVSRRAERLRVTVIVAVRNEGPAMVRAMLDSLIEQTRLPQRVHVVENGAAEPTMRDVFHDWMLTVPGSVEALFDHTPVPGKRTAQAIAVQADPAADVYATVDSDVVLQPDAMERGVAPFGRRRTMSVGGMLYGANTHRNLLTRLVELGYACSFLNGRCAYSMLKSVNVQCGALAWYRGWVWRKYLPHYLSHTVAGRYMQYGDDAMLTRYAAFEGECLMQVSAVGQTLHPERLRHLTKQRLRWWRSFFWGNEWLLRTIRPTHPLWWITVANFVRFVWFAGAIAVILILRPAVSGDVAWLFFAWLVGVSYLQTARYLTVWVPEAVSHADPLRGTRNRRETFRSQFGTWALAPAASLLNLFLGPVLQVAGLATCLRTGWSTRVRVEVELADPDDTPVAGPRSDGSGLPATAAS